MRFSALLIGSVAPTLIAAHGKIAAVQGDAGGNGTAIGIQGGIIPGPGKNKITEPDTTVFKKTDIATDGLGKTKGNGKNTVAMLADTMAQSGSTLPQVSDGGMITGTFHIVTTDGAGPVSAMIDPTGTGAFAAGVQANVMQDVPGKKGNIKPNGEVPRSLEYLALRARSLVKRASNVNQDYPIAIQVPPGMTCSGTAAGQKNVCFMKIANSNKAGPFGGVIAFQMTGGAAAGNTTAPAGTDGNAQGGAGAGAGAGADKNGNGNAQGGASDGNGQAQGGAGADGNGNDKGNAQGGAGAGADKNGNAQGGASGGNDQSSGGADDDDQNNNNNNNNGRSIAKRFAA
ncbi:hypothetical protein EKO04_004036 [Ascochyta lentis]|uniref:Uncharacterized protein n=1 Tax=Ascochyta lentis TaxID=205686 RepID=A0A8H7J6V8_9PLEO|nr:hypothetical protein EKO04_004036 [Ascochyta lentis]